MHTSCLPYSDYKCQWMYNGDGKRVDNNTHTCDNTYKGNAVLVDPALQVF